MLSCSGLSGKVYQLNNNLGEGGEGIVYDLLNDTSMVAKVYKPSHFATKDERAATERKLKAMLSMGLSGYVDGLLLFTWPQDILYQNGTMVGYLMPRVNSKLKIYSIYRMGNDVKSIYPDFTWKNSVQFAYNLAWVVQYLHSKDIVVGDFNQNNICIDTKTSATVLIDCDSYDITDPKTGEHFPCKVGFSEVLAPELQTVGNLKNGSFTKESDDFSLAIHIFRLLMRNADPFGGIIASGASTSSIPQNQAIVNGECQYVRNVGKTIPTWSPGLDAMPPEIRKLFDKTFNYTAVTAVSRIHKRATAMEWCNALIPYARPGRNRKLKTCPNNKLHVYAAHNRKCPWCVCEGHDYDPDTVSFEKTGQIFRRLVYSVVIISLLAGLVCLYRSGNDIQTLWHTFCGNLLMIRSGLTENLYIYGLKTGLTIIRDHILQSFRNLVLPVTYFLSADRKKNFIDNNQIIIHRFAEHLQNLSIMIPFLLKRISALAVTARDDILFFGQKLMKKIKGLVPIGGE